MIALLPLGAVAAQTDARVGVFTEYAVPPQTRVEVPIEIRGVQNLYAIDVELRYDPALMDFEEAKTFQPTVVFPKEGNKV